jgi:hypothetical protein
MKIKWVKPESDEPFFNSDDGRFEIEPLYWGRETPQGFVLRDIKTGKKQNISFGGISRAKAMAEKILGDEASGIMVSSCLQAKETNRFNKMAAKIVAMEMPSWTMPEFINQLDISGTPLKRFSGQLQGFPIWALKAKAKIYKDVYGWVSVSWTVNPTLHGQEWVVESNLSFAPATTGSFANEKFDKFKKEVSISGEKGFAVFGIEVRVLSIKPDEGNAAREINGIISQHGRDLVVAKKYWKEQAILFKGRLAMNREAMIAERVVARSMVGDVGVDIRGTWSEESAYRELRMKLTHLRHGDAQLVVTGPMNSPEEAERELKKILGEWLREVRGGMVGHGAMIKWTDLGKWSAAAETMVSPS